MSDQLTRHKEGSIRELWTLAYPMILAFLSGNIMIFVDRLFLANYSTAAMNAATAAGMMVAIFQYGTATITSIAEVFVGKFNGAKEYLRVAAPVWQMLWFSLLMGCVFFLLATNGGPYLLSTYHYEDQGLPYYQWLMYFGAATPAIAALSSFFVGIGKTRYVMVTTIVGNLLNVILDIICIFGIPGWFEAMGAKGAAIATGVSQFAQVLVFGTIFLRRRYRETYGSAVWKLDITLFFHCLRVGVPNAIGHMIEWAAWALSIRMMAVAGEVYLTVATVGQSMYMLVAFGFEGIQKAITTLAANRLGANRIDDIWLTWRAGIKLLMMLAIPFGIVMLWYPDPIIAEFLSTEHSPSEIIVLTSLLRSTAVGVFLYYLCDGFTWISVGILTAIEDTWFIMWMNACTAWLCGLMPVLLCMVYLQWSPAWYFYLICIYGMSNGLIFYRRLVQKIH